MGRDTLNKCTDCGRFLSKLDYDEGHFHFIPLNEFGPEEIEWTCKKCLDKSSKVVYNAGNG